MCEKNVYLHSKINTMKTLKKLFTENPGYTKWGNARIAKVTGLKETTVSSYKRTMEFKAIKSEYITKCKNKSL